MAVVVRVTSAFSTVFIVVFNNNKVKRVYSGSVSEYHDVYKWRSAFNEIATARIYNDSDIDMNYHDFSVDSIEAVDRVIGGMDSYRLKLVYGF